MSQIDDHKYDDMRGDDLHTNLKQTPSPSPTPSKSSRGSAPAPTEAPQASGASSSTPSDAVEPPSDVVEPGSEEPVSLLDELEEVAMLQDQMKSLTDAAEAEAEADALPGSNATRANQAKGGSRQGSQQSGASQRSQRSMPGSNVMPSSSFGEEGQSDLVVGLDDLSDEETFTSYYYHHPTPSNEPYLDRASMSVPRNRNTTNTNTASGQFRETGRQPAQRQQQYQSVSQQQYMPQEQPMPQDQYMSQQQSMSRPQYTSQHQYMSRPQYTVEPGYNQYRRGQEEFARGIEWGDDNRYNTPNSSQASQRSSHSSSFQPSQRSSFQRSSLHSSSPLSPLSSLRIFDPHSYQSPDYQHHQDNYLLSTRDAILPHHTSLSRPELARGDIARVSLVTDGDLDDLSAPLAHTAHHLFETAASMAMGGIRSPGSDPEYLQIVDFRSQTDNQPERGFRNVKYGHHGREHQYTESFPHTSRHTSPLGTHSHQLRPHHSLQQQDSVPYALAFETDESTSSSFTGSRFTGPGRSGSRSVHRGVNMLSDSDPDDWSIPLFHAPTHVAISTGQQRDSEGRNFTSYRRGLSPVHLPHGYNEDFFNEFRENHDIFMRDGRNLNSYESPQHQRHTSSQSQSHSHSRPFYSQNPSFVDRLAGAAENAVDNVEDAASGVVRGVEDTAGRFTRGIARGVNRVQDSVQDGWEDVKEGVSDVFNTHPYSHSNSHSNSLSRGLSRGASGLSDTISRGASNFKDELRTGMRDVQRDLQSSDGRHMWDDVAHDVKRAGQRVSNTLYDTQQRLSDSVHNTLNSQEGILASVMEDSVDDLDDHSVCFTDSDQSSYDSQSDCFTDAESISDSESVFTDCD